MGLLTDDMKRVVREQVLGFMATVCPDGTPNLSPKGTLLVWDDDHLVFADIVSPMTMSNLAANPAIELNVVDPVLRKGYRFKGRAQVHTSGAMFEQVLQFFHDERNIDTSRIRGIAMIEVERAAALISPAYAGGTSEDEIEGRSVRRLETIHGWKIERLDAEG